MSDSNIYTIKDLPKDQTDLKKARKMTERQINKAARSDKDAKPLKKSELSQLKRVHQPEDIDVKKIRKDLHVSQTVFAACFGVSKGTLQAWEQGRRHPQGPAKILLILISKRPRLINEILSK